MSGREEMDLALRVLDQQVVDWSGRRCGRVDDVVFEGKPGARAVVKGFVVGRDATRSRRPWPLSLLRRGAPTFGDAPEVEVPWSAIAEITHVIKLEEEAEDMNLAAGDRRACKWLEWIPKS